jgi:copper chaperone CopZ
MTCGGCVARVKSELLKLGDVTEAEVQLGSPQATIWMQRHVPLKTLQDAVAKAGNYMISEDASLHSHAMQTDEDTSTLSAYKPILLVGAFIVGVTVLIELRNPVFDWHSWMQNFMAAFFIVFSFFKLLDVKAFAESYSTYDIVARSWMPWGYIYPFVELFLGIAYLLRFEPLLTNGVAFVVMSVSIIGVLQSVLNKRKIRCACLGAVFNIPMSTITIIEDALMIAMSGAMLVSIL